MYICVELVSKSFTDVGIQLIRWYELVKYSVKFRTHDDNLITKCFQVKIIQMEYYIIDMNKEQDRFLR